MKATLKAALIAAIVAVTPTPTDPLQASRSAECGHYPEVPLHRDCYRPSKAKFRRIHRLHPLRCIRSIESGGRYTATSSPRGTYRGAYQFSRSTWASVGPARFDHIDPVHAPRWLQDRRAWRLYKRRGLQPWPTPNVRCK